tara:strand:+ start:182 stop:559 length:378 start_codon:yes stop_codon:yes gene_type:complete
MARSHKHKMHKSSKKLRKHKGGIPLGISQDAQAARTDATAVQQHLKSFGSRSASYLRNTGKSWMNEGRAFTSKNWHKLKRQGNSLFSKGEQFADTGVNKVSHIVPSGGWASNKKRSTRRKKHHRR